MGEFDDLFVVAGDFSKASDAFLLPRATGPNALHVVPLIAATVTTIDLGDVFDKACAYVSMVLDAGTAYMLGKPGVDALVTPVAAGNAYAMTAGGGTYNFLVSKGARYVEIVHAEGTNLRWWVSSPIAGT